MNQDQSGITELVQRAAQGLAEHVDSVQIFVTKHEGASSSTLSYEYGVGSFYTRLGQVGEWMVIQDQYQREEARRRDQSREEEDQE